MENPVAGLLRETLPHLDFAVLRHGFASHGRDYVFSIQDWTGSHELIFTHVVEFRYETRVDDKLWSASWSDEFLNYDAWLSAGEPKGHVWGTDWSLAYPGISLPAESKETADWSRRLGHPMHPFLIETERFEIRLIFSKVLFVSRSNNTLLTQKSINLTN